MPFRDKQVRNKWQRNQRKILKRMIFDKYNNQCNICGFNNPLALQIDHVKGGGTKDRRKHTLQTYYKYILNHSNKFNLLCANCNFIKRYTNHEIKLCQPI